MSATYVLGDIQGCYQTLRRLLRRLDFRPGRGDRLWLVGDLVNRGPRSLEVLRWAADLGEALVSVLGNHDLHLLSVAAGRVPLRRGDTLQPLLDAPDAADLCAWLRRRPLLHVEGGFALVHAGLLPAWSVAEARELARATEARLRGPNGDEMLARYRDPVPAGALGGLDRPDLLRLFLRASTLLRTCGSGGRLHTDFDGPLSNLPPGRFPWFRHPGRRSLSHTLLFGHWAALGLHLEPGLCALDSGCVWGGSLSAYRLGDGTVTQEPADPSEIAERG